MPQEGERRGREGGREEKLIISPMTFHRRVDVDDEVSLFMLGQASSTRIHVYALLSLGTYSRACSGSGRVHDLLPPMAVYTHAIRIVARGDWKGGESRQIQAKGIVLLLLLLVRIPAAYRNFFPLPRAHASRKLRNGQKRPFSLLFVADSSRRM